MEIIGLIGIVVSLALFLILVYKGWHTYWVAPICAIIVALTNQLDPLTAFNETYVNGLLSIFFELFAIIFLGSILAKIFADAGMASSIAKTLIDRFIAKKEGDKQIRVAFLCVIIMTGLCTLGGIDGYVLTFIMIPILMEIARIINIPRYFVPGMMTLNVAFMICPGAPQIYNVMGVAGINSITAQNGVFVTPTAGLIPGIIATVIIAVLGYFTICHMAIKIKNKGGTFEYGGYVPIELKNRRMPSFWLSILPLVTVFILFALFNFDISIALTVGIIIAIIIGVPFIEKKDGFNLPVSRGRALINTLNNGSTNYPNALLTVVTPAALAAVITATAAFGLVVGFFGGLAVNPLILTVIVVCVVVAITSSPPAALMIALPMVLGIVYSTGGTVNPNAVMRIGVVAAATFETLPFNGLIILTIGLARTTHKHAYKFMFINTVGYTLLATIVVTALYLIFPGII